MHIKIKTLFFLFFSLTSFAAEKTAINYKYKAKETIDLGGLSINGDVIAPSDLSSRNRESRQLKLKIPIRKDMEDFILNEIEISY